jgi:hypothetical protein
VLIGTFVFGEPMAATPAGLGLQVIAAVAAVAGIALLGSAGPAGLEPASIPGEPSGPRCGGAIVSGGHRAELKKKTVTATDATRAAPGCGDAWVGTRR